ncbi:type 1 glutamine amidotransferase [Schaalia sp. lx-260]|uniref:type 1 glutamine amidotransferase n=1 Tax=Schaalia sp. lx-260 TaxID=2899082 RepID=UPI001E305260|nr:type 1 glutamine amidotransferase [Schaalia sp. lx-260]MCD4549893.1 type 1 glutamine amidotransferase [Schaalia sp. lx-260]
MSTVLVIEHDPLVTLGNLEQLLCGKYEHVRAWEKPQAVDRIIEDIECGARPFPSAVVILGGRMNAYADEAGPWFPATRHLIRDCAQRQVRLLGICLGHQIIATALNGSVALAFPENRECGITQIRWENKPTTLHADESALWDSLQETSHVFADHGDAVSELPPHALVWARSQRCVHIMSCGTVIGVQFHPEVTESIIHSWAQSDPQTYTQDIHDEYALHRDALFDTCTHLAQWLLGPCTQ